MRVNYLQTAAFTGLLFLFLISSVWPASSRTIFPNELVVYEFDLSGYETYTVNAFGASCLVPVVCGSPVSVLDAGNSLEIFLFDSTFKSPYSTTYTSENGTSAFLSILNDSFEFGADTGSIFIALRTLSDPIRVNNFYVGSFHAPLILGSEFDSFYINTVPTPNAGILLFGSLFVFFCKFNRRFSSVKPRWV